MKMIKKCLKKYLKKDICLQTKDRKAKISYNSIIIEYQKIINLLGSTLNQPTKFWSKTWVEITDDSRGTHNTNSQIDFKTSMLRSCLCDYNDTYTLVSGTIIITGAGADYAVKILNERNKGAIF